MTMDLEKLIKYAIKLGASDAEIFIRRTEIKGVKVETDTYKGNSSRDIEASIRIGIGKRVASQSLTSADDKELKNTIERTMKMAKVIGEDPYWSGLPESSHPFLKSLYYDLRIDGTGIEEMTKYLKNIKKEFLDYNDRIKGVIAGIDVIKQHIEFINSNGVSYSEDASGEEFAISITARENNIYTSSFEYKRSRKYFDDFLEIGYKAADKAIEFLSSKALNNQVKRIIFDPLSISAILFHSLIYGLSGDYVLEGVSPLKEKLGKKIASESITVYDDGTIPGGWRTSIYDDEGVPRRRTLLIDRGVLKSYLHNHYTASRMNTNSTGNAERRGTAVTVHASNILFKDGRASLHEILSEISEGIYITGYPLSAHTINTSTGDASVVFQEAYYIENKEIKWPLKPVTISGNVYEALKNMIPLKGLVETPYSIYIPPIYSEGFVVR